MNRELEAVLFDAGGVLWDLRPSVEDLFAEALETHGVARDRPALTEALREADRALDQDFAKLDGGDESGFWRRYDDIVLERLGAEVDRDVFAKELSSRLRAVVREVASWEAYPDAIPTLRKVRDRRLKTALVSNATELARRVLRNLGMEGYFDVVVISDEVGVRKPDPRIFRIALDGIGTDPSRSMFLGDKPGTDIAGARLAGVRGVLVDRNRTFLDCSCPRITSLDELEGLL